MSSRHTTIPGYLNRNGQTVVRATGLPGTDYGQSIYVLHCSHCEHEYGANDSDIHLRKCPKCQSGRPGLFYDIELGTPLSTATATRKARLKNDLIGVAGVHFVAFKLSMRGLVVLPTIRNTAGVDLLVNDPKTGAHSSLQVKTSQDKVKFWLASVPENVLRGVDHYYVFLRFLKERDTFQAFLTTGADVAKQIAANIEEDAAQGRKVWPNWRLPAGPTEIQALEAAWEKWRPGRQDEPVVL